MSCRGRGKAIRDLQVFWGFSSWIQRSTHEVAIAGSREYQVETKYTPCTHLYDTATHTNHNTENVSHTCGLLHSSLLSTSARITCHAGPSRVMQAQRRFWPDAAVTDTRTRPASDGSVANSLELSGASGAKSSAQTLR